MEELNEEQKLIASQILSLLKAYPSKAKDILNCCYEGLGDSPFVEEHRSRAKNYIKKLARENNCEFIVVTSSDYITSEESTGVIDKRFRLTPYALDKIFKSIGDSTVSIDSRDKTINIDIIQELYAV